MAFWRAAPVASAPGARMANRFLDRGILRLEADQLPGQFEERGAQPRLPCLVTLPGVRFPPLLYSPGRARWSC